jgi:hypothetical protein
VVVVRPGVVHPEVLRGGLAVRLGGGLREKEDVGQVAWVACQVEHRTPQISEAAADEHEIVVVYVLDRAEQVDVPFGDGRVRVLDLFVRHRTIVGRMAFAPHHYQVLAYLSHSDRKGSLSRHFAARGP